MMSVLLTFLRLSSDNEIVALKASGISIYHLLPPVILFSLLNMVLTGYMGIYGIPWGEYSYKQMAMNVVQSNFNIGLKERRFNDSFDGVMFYVNKIDLKDNSLGDIFIEDQRNEGFSTTIVSPKGRIFNGEDKLSFILSLDNGVINQVGLKNRTVHNIRFDTYDLKLDLKNAVKKIKERKRNENEMYLGELVGYLKTEKPGTKKYFSAWVEFHKKFSIPFACIALGILAVPLGVQTSSSRRSAGLGIGLAAFLIYYLLLSAGLLFSEAGNISPALGMWMPNVVMGGLGIFLLIRTANDRPVGFFDRINQFFIRVFKLFFRVRFSN